MTSISIVHEAETQRQHARLRVPAIVQVGGHTLEAREISVGGVGLPPSELRVRVGQRVALALQIPFDDFRLSFEVEGEVRHAGGGEQGPGLAFTGLSRRQISMLHEMINSYLCGQLLRVGDVFEVAGRDAFVAPRNKKVSAQPEAPSLGFRIRRIFGYAIIATAGLCLFAFVAVSLVQRIFVAEATGTLSGRSAAIVRAPEGGLVHDSLVEPGSAVETGAVLLSIETSLGSIAMVRSPCDCRLATTFVVGGQYVQVNEALVAMTPENSAQVVVGHLPLQSARGIAPGDLALVDFYDGTGTISGVVVEVRPQSVDPTGYAGQSFGAEPIARIEIELEEAQPLDRIGQPVAFRISSLPFLSSWFSTHEEE